MAAQALIDLAKLNLPSWRETVTDWDEAKIGNVLDRFKGNVSQTARQFWVQRVSDTQPITDVGGSDARPLSQDHDHAVNMLAYWDQQIGRGSDTTFGKIRRRYKRPVGTVVPLDPYGYGGAYARTD